MRSRTSHIARRPNGSTPIGATAPDALTPIAGVSIGAYAEVRAHMVGSGDDRNGLDRIVSQHAIPLDAWRRADAGWAARMEDPSTAHVVATEYSALYRAALQRRRTAGRTVSDA